MSDLIFRPAVLKKKSRVWYIEDTDIRYSFNMLEKIAKDLGADVESGDILIADNVNKTRRKVFKKIEDGKYVILYLSSTETNTFVSLGENKKKIQGSMLSRLIFH